MFSIYNFFNLSAVYNYIVVAFVTDLELKFKSIRRSV